MKQTVYHILQQKYLLYYFDNEWYIYFDGLAQDCSNSTANALELLQFCSKPSILYLSRLADPEKEIIPCTVHHWKKCKKNTG